MQCDQGHDEKRKRTKMAKETMGVGIAIKRGLCNLGFDGQIGACHTDWGEKQPELSCSLPKPCLQRLPSVAPSLL